MRGVDRVLTCVDPFALLIGPNVKTRPLFATPFHENVHTITWNSTTDVFCLSLCPIMRYVVIQAAHQQVEL